MKQQFGRYEIIEAVGSGGFAVVYRARDTALNREVAVKVMRPLLMSDPDFVARFEKEAQVAANLDHPHIISIYDYGEHEGRLYLVMKLMAASLEQPIDKGPIPFAQVVDLLPQIAAGLDYAHQRGVVHRDIKPDNVLLDEQGRAVVADFGLVKAMQSSHSLTMSISGGILGTPAYMAPELWHGQPATPAVDIYALGCLLYEMVMGRKLFDAPTPPSIMALHFAGPTLPDRWPQGVPPGLSDVLTRALAHDLTQRYQSAGEMAAALAQLSLDPLAEPYHALQTAVAQQKWSDAITLAESILNQRPNYKDVGDLLAQALAGKNAAEQAVWVQQWREQAQAAQARGDWSAALAAAQQWQQVARDKSEPERFIQAIQKANQPATSKSVPAVDKQSATENDSLQPSPTSHWLKRVPTWGWVAAGLTGIVAFLILLFMIFGPASGDISPQIAESHQSSLDESEITPTATPVPNRPPLTGQLGDEWLRPVDEMVMVYVPAPDEPFELGRGLAAPGDGFWIDKHPVTNAQYRLCVDDGVCSPSARAEDTNFNGDDYPVVSVSWFDASDYVGWLNEAIPDGTDWVYALPDEAEWEYAAVGDSGWAYPWGDEIANCELANIGGCVGGTAPAGSYPDGVSWVGALDMAGNVWEWTDSWRDEDETRRVLRGGSWLLVSNAARAAVRLNASPDNRSNDLYGGFRVVLVRRSPSHLDH